jgi:hypothetical protein
VTTFRSASIVCALWLTPALAGLAYAQTATDLTCIGCVGNGDLANNAVRSSKISDGSVTSSDLAKNSVTGTHIVIDAVTYPKLGPGVRRWLDNAISNVTTVAAEDAGVGTAGADCPSGRIAVSASCVCDNNGGNNNYGVLFACAVDGNGAIAACFDEAGTFNPTKPSPVAIVQANCLGGETSDGTPWVPQASGAVSPSATPSDFRRTPEDEAAWHKAQHERFLAALAALKQQQAAHRGFMQGR